MHEDNTLAPVELRPNGLEGRITQIRVSRTVAREESHTICLKCVKCISKFCQCGLGVQETRQISNKAESVRLLITKLCGVNVQFAGKIC